ncbi:MAG: KEOPS complex kinase/ATPase Bud32 [Candidatus Micrarchaeota archaeon]
MVLSREPDHERARAVLADSAQEGSHAPGSFAEGAEAVLLPDRFLSYPALRKVRLQKPYRPPALDARIRSSRTRIEARLLSKSKSAGVPCPHVFAVGADYILMEKLGGCTLNRLAAGRIPAWACERAGIFLARLHSAGIIHGDYTPANLMWDKKNAKDGKEGKDADLFVIDFGLGSISSDIEDHAVDVLTMKKALKGEKEQKAFMDGYEKEGGTRTARAKEGEARTSAGGTAFSAPRVLVHMAEVEKRARYQDRGG